MINISDTHWYLLGMYVATFYWCSPIILHAHTHACACACTHTHTRRYLVSNLGTLVILETRLEDEGVYRAVVSNGAGEVHTQTTLEFYFSEWHQPVRRLARIAAIIRMLPKIAQKWYNALNLEWYIWMLQLASLSVECEECLHDHRVALFLGLFEKKKRPDIHSLCMHLISQHSGNSGYRYCCIFNRILLIMATCMEILEDVLIHDNKM